MYNILCSFLGVFLALYTKDLIEKYKFKKQVIKISNRNEHKLEEFFERL